MCLAANDLHSQESSSWPNAREEYKFESTTPNRHTGKEWTEVGKSRFYFVEEQKLRQKQQGDPLYQLRKKFDQLHLHPRAWRGYSYIWWNTSILVLHNPLCWVSSTYSGLPYLGKLSCHSMVPTPGITIEKGTTNSRHYYFPMHSRWRSREERDLVWSLIFSSPPWYEEATPHPLLPHMAVSQRH